MTISRLVGVIVIVVLLSYFGFQLHLLWSPPALLLSSPPPDLITSERSIEIVGRTDPGAKVVINNTPIPTGGDGTFSKLLVLNKGINNITISAKKRYSRSRVVERQILIQDSENLSRANNSIN
ncbi:MAG: hypothetical protein UX17_C0048G0011 [Parcubacteria group bacterium GW2011_GWC2_45_7]|nr:MAG: hypothetical protein UX17_C0048G0011 [Parcubacteria group bacterium GW2011_GWC2_45_7]KKU71916.1 MAG: hypothetical protein UX98_C0021G0010 [Parcubacteria group bacterium GW2011_GWA2_47_26]